MWIIQVHPLASQLCAARRGTFEHLRNLLREYTLSTHPGTEPRVIQFPASNGPNTTNDFVLLLGEIEFELLEN